MPITISPFARFDVTKHHLISTEDQEIFGAKIIACCLASKEMYDQVALSLNFDNQRLTYTRSDFLNPLDGMLYALISNFGACWCEGNPWPANRAEWARAILPHLTYYFKVRRDTPELYRTAVLQRVVTLPSAAPGDFDLVCDGLIDYISGVRYHFLSADTQHLDPGAKRTAFEALALTIRIPSAAVILQSNDAIMDQIFALQQPAKPFYTGVRMFDHYYGEKAQGGDAWLAFGHPGGGKTNLACQTAGHTAARGKLVAYVTTEVKKATILQRCCAAEAGINYGILRAMNGNKGHPQASVFANWVNTVGKNIQIFDYRDVAGKDYKEKFKRMMEAFHKQFGRMPDLTIWDWIGKALDSGFPDPWAKREAYNGVASLMVDSADEYDNASLTLAQASKESKNRTNLTEQDTADSRSLCDGMEGVVGITSLIDNTERNASTQECHKEFQYLVVCKCREEQALRISVKRHFELARFESV